MNKLFWATAGAAIFGLASIASADQELDPTFVTGVSTGVNTDYNVVTTPDPGGPGGSWAEGTVAVTKNPFFEHDLWSSFTTPSGDNMLAVNGAVVADERIWYETVQPGTYDFGALVANMFPDSPAVLTLELNGSAIGSTFSALSPDGTWTKWNETVTVGSQSVLSIVDLNTVASGNDVALTGVPDGGLTAAMLGLAMTGLGAARRFVK